MRLFRFVADKIGFMVEYLSCRRAGVPDRTEGAARYAFSTLIMTAALLSVLTTRYTDRFDISFTGLL